MRSRWGVLVGAAVVALGACSKGGETPVPTSAPPESVLTLTSPAFADGEPIPERHTCDGEEVSPALRWTGVPDGTAELALIVDDPDAPGGNFTHWVVWGIDPTGEIAEGAAPAGAQQGKNDFGDENWGGPCPPGGTHHYRFELLALSAPPDVGPGAGANDLRRATQGGVLGRAVLVGTYER